MRNVRTVTLTVLIITTGLLLSCSESDIGTGNSNSEQRTAENINALAAKQVQKDFPQKVFAEFQEMVEKVEKMNRAEIDSLSDEEVLKLGEPILKATEGTVTYSKKTLEKLVEPLYAISENVRTLTKKEHSALSKEAEQILASDTDRKTRDLSPENIRELLIKFNGGGTTMSSSGCESTFDVTPAGQVLLYPGDNLSMANGVCPAGSVFYVMAGTHTGQFVSSSRTGNTWAGVGVNPGNAGIGAAGGEYISVNDNKINV